MLNCDDQSCLHIFLWSAVQIYFIYSLLVTFCSIYGSTTKIISFPGPFFVSDLYEWPENEPVTSLNRQVKHDVYGQRQKRNFCRLSSVVCTVEWNYVYLQWEVGDVITFSWAFILRIRRKELTIRSFLCRLPPAFNVIVNLSNLNLFVDSMEI